MRFSFIKLFCVLFLASSLYSEPIIIGIAGGSASGKTTFAERLQEVFQDDVIILSQDGYFKNFPHLTFDEKIRLNWDCPDAIDFDLLVEHLRDLKEGKSIEQPIRNFSTFSRETFTKTLESAPIIVLDGVLIFAVPEILDLCDIKIFIEADDDVRLMRRLKRDVHGRGISMDDVLLQYAKTVKPMHDIFAESGKVHADIIIPKGAESPVSFDLVQSAITQALGK